MIRISNLSKQYRLGGAVGFDATFREAISSFFSREKSDQTTQSKMFWALDDLSLTIPEGKSVGIIGHNGAGKSTLLKLLSRITYPTKGSIELHGSSASLLEVGTGFHPELTGLENIYLYGTIMGMSRRDINRRLEEIVEYAGVTKFLDTPVKRYSSGMHMRLAFSVAAHVDPDILIVDEVLAVGDREFREKCLGKMGEVAESGRTVIFVSHNMGSITSLCDEVAWLEQGRLVQFGAANEVVNAYKSKVDSDLEKGVLQTQFGGALASKIAVNMVAFDGTGNSLNPSFDINDDVVIKVQGESRESFDKVQFSLIVICGDTRIAEINDVVQPERLSQGEFSLSFTIPKGCLAANQYSLGFGAKANNGDWFWNDKVAQFNLSDPNADLLPSQALVLPSLGHGVRHD